MWTGGSCREAWIGPLAELQQRTAVSFLLCAHEGVLYIGRRCEADESTP